MIGAPPTATPPLTTEASMAVKIEQLEQRLATMASFQHRSHSEGKAPTSYGGDDLFYMASVAQIEASVVMTRGVCCNDKRRHLSLGAMWGNYGVGSIEG